jgi:hypothetical protein
MTYRTVSGANQQNVMDASRPKNIDCGGPPPKGGIQYGKTMVVQTFGKNDQKVYHWIAGKWVLQEATT